MRNIDNDVSYGKKHEKICMKFLNKHKIFGGNFTSTDVIDKFHNFDMNNGLIFVEHKKRPDLYFNKMYYDSLYFDKVKYTKYLELSKKNPEAEFYIIWTCEDGRFYWKFQPQFNDKDEAQFYETIQYHQDRGKGYPQDTPMINVFREEIKKLC